MEQNIVLLFENLSFVHLKKDVFLLPYYLGHEMGYNVRFVYSPEFLDETLPSEYRGVRLVPLRLRGNPHSWFLYREWEFFVYTLCHAREIDVLIRFHLTLVTALLLLLYKLLNPRGKAYVKLDGYLPALFGSKRKSLAERLKYKVMRMALRKIDLFTCETSRMYERFIGNAELKFLMRDKLYFLPNGFDEAEIGRLQIEERKYGDKENVMITVGRLGVKDKNTEMLLNALAQVNLKDWKVYLIGPIEPTFIPFIDDFFKKNPEKRERVIFTDSISDKQELWDYYNRAKVFVLTSRAESYALVLNEAKRFRDYIVSTDVGAAHDLLESRKYGVLVDQENPAALACVCQDIIDGKRRVDVYPDFDPSVLAWDGLIRNARICEKLR